MEKKNKDISEPDLTRTDDLQFNSVSGSTLPIKEPEKDETDENNMQNKSAKDSNDSSVSSGIIYHPLHDENERKFERENYMNYDTKEGKICDPYTNSHDSHVLSPRSNVESDKPKEKRDAVRESRKGNKPYLNIKTGMLVTVTGEYKQKELSNDILRLICAWLNNEANFPLTFTNENREKTTTHDFDVWIDRIEKDITRYFFRPTASFIEVIGDCKSQKITFHKKKTVTQFCSLNTHLYFPSVSSHTILMNQEAVKILLQDELPHNLKELKEREYNMFQPLNDQRNETIDVQFKAITGGDVPNTLANACFNYISAFCNHIGGEIIFGIDDKEAKVLGVPVSEAIIEEIESNLADKVQSLKFGAFDQKMEKGIHWDIHFLPIQMDGVYYRVKDDSETFLSFKKGQTMKLIEKSFEQLWFFEESKQKKRGLARADYFKEIETDGLFTAVKNFTVQGIYKKGEILKFIDKDNHDEWWNFVTVDGKKKRLHYSFVIKENFNVVVVRVCKIPGGVFTDDPEAYYADETGKVYQYTLERWKTKTIESAKDEAEKTVQDIQDYNLNKKGFVKPIDIKLGSSIPFDEIPSYSESWTSSQTTAARADEFRAIHHQTHNHKHDKALSVNTLEANLNENSFMKRSPSDQLNKKRDTSANTELQDSVRLLSDEKSQEAITKMNDTESQVGSDILRASTNEHEKGYVRQRCSELVTSIWSALTKLCCCKQRSRTH